MHRGSDPELADGRGSRRWNRPAYGARRPERLCRQSYRVVCRDGFIDWVLCLRWNGRRRCETHGRGRKLFGAARRAACSSCNRCAWGDLRSGPGLPTMGHARHLSLHRHRVSYGSFDQPGVPWRDIGLVVPACVAIWRCDCPRDDPQSVVARTVTRLPHDA